MTNARSSVLELGHGLLAALFLQIVYESHNLSSRRKFLGSVFKHFRGYVFALLVFYGYGRFDRVVVSVHCESYDFLGIGAKFFRSAESGLESSVP